MMYDVIQSWRQDYQSPVLLEDNVAQDPLEQFHRWFEEAGQHEPHEPNAMTLATAALDGRPSARIVLLKNVDSQGFVFFTNFSSRKGRELLDNPLAALVFYWPVSHRQVRIEGRVERVEEEVSDAYFAGRPREAQLGAWASQQSQPVASRQVLEEIRSSTQERHGEDPIPRPEFWGGYRVVPDTYEFWQGRPSRYHDRLVYARTPNGWAIHRLMP